MSWKIFLKKYLQPYNQAEAIKQLAYKYKDARDFLYLGRGYNFPIALEGALEAEGNFLYSCRRLSCSRNETWPHCAG